MYLDYKADNVMAERTGGFLSLTNRDGLLYMRERGYKHVQSMHKQGELECLEGVALPSLRKAVSKPPLPLGDA